MATQRANITDVNLSTYGQPVSPVGGGSVAIDSLQSPPAGKTITIQGPYNANIGNSGAVADTLTVSADYGIWDTTNNIPIDVNATNFKDPW
jgi:hypothetical protein